MKLGVFLAVFHDRRFEDALDSAAALGLDAATWRGIVTALRDAGAVSIEHEDRLLPADEGLAKAVDVLAALL